MNYPETRKQSLKEGVKYYFTGKPCKRGHINKRFTTTCGCVECVSGLHKRWVEDNGERVEQQRTRYRKNNPDKVKQSNKQWCESNPDYHNQHYKDNPEYYEQYSEAYREANREYYKQYQVQYRKDNPDKLSVLSSKYRAAKIQAIPKWYEEKQVELLYKKCKELNNRWKVNFQVDHIIPLNSKTVCGLHCWNNLQLLEGTDNSSKNNRYHCDT